MKDDSFRKYLFISLAGALGIILCIVFFFTLFRFQQVMDGIRTLENILMPFIYGAVGVHPQETENLREEDMQWLKEKAKQPKVVAIGEIGLDYYWPEPDKAIQKKWFIRQLSLATQTGLPVMRPLVLEYPEDEQVRNRNDEFLLGDRMLVSPVVEQGAREKLVYLPEGVWYDYWTGETLEGGQSYIRKAPLDTCPIFVKAGAVIPKYPVRTHVGKEKDELLILETYPGEGIYTHYQDNGEDFEYRRGAYNEYRLINHNGRLDMEMLHEGYQGYGKIEIRNKSQK